MERGEAHESEGGEGVWTVIVSDGCVGRCSVIAGEIEENSSEWERRFLCACKWE